MVCYILDGNYYSSITDDIPDDATVITKEEFDSHYDGVIREREEFAVMHKYEGLSYEEIVSTLIRERYSIDDELALHRQRDSKAEEFEQYYAFCEECKAKAKEILNERRK